MPNWAERIENHRILALVAEIGPLLEQADTAAEDNAVSMEGVARLRVVQAFLEKMLSALNPLLANPAPLDQAYQHLDQLKNQLTEFLESGNEGNIENANKHADGIVAALSQLPVHDTVESLDGLRDAVTSLRRGIGQHLRWIDSDVEPLKGKVSGIESRVNEVEALLNSQREQVAGVISQFQGQFSEAQERRRAQFEEAKKEHDDALKGELGQWRTQLDAAVKAHEEQLDTLIEELREKSKESARASEAKLGEITSQARDAAKSALDEIQQRRVKAEQLVGVIGNLGVTSGYQKVANYARRVGWFWQITTLGSLGGLIFVAYRMFMPIVTGEFSWEGFAGRVFLTLTIGGLAAYAGYQADRYQRLERESRRVELDLESIGPYLADLPEEQQQGVKLQMADRTFGRPLQHGGQTPTSVVEAIVKSKEFRALVAEVVRAAKG